MHCRNCGRLLDDKAVVCTSCGVPPLIETKFCNNCGVETTPSQAICTKCGVRLRTAGTGEKNKIAAGLLGIFLGAFGIHKFYLGYTKEGIIMLVISLAVGIPTCGMSTGVMSIIGFIEGIIYVTKSDEEFEGTYVQNQKGWF